MVFFPHINEVTIASNGVETSIWANLFHLRYLLSLFGTVIVISLLTFLRAHSLVSDFTTNFPADDPSIFDIKTNKTGDGDTKRQKNWTDDNISIDTFHHRFDYRHLHMMSAPFMPNAIFERNVLSPLFGSSRSIVFAMSSIFRPMSTGQLIT